MNTRNFAIVLWRVMGILFILDGLGAVVLQYAAANYFGPEIANETMTEVLVFIWPVLAIVIGIVFISASRPLANLVVRGLGNSDS